MESRGLPRLTARTRRGATLLWALFFIFSIGLQYMGAFAPAPALAAASPTTASGTLYFTRFCAQGGTASCGSTAGMGTDNVGSVDFTFDGTTFNLATPTGIASAHGADGIIFAPNGHLLVAGQQDGKVYEITTGGSAVTNQPAGVISDHLSISPDGTHLLIGPTSSGGHGLGTIPMSSGGLGGAGSACTVTGADHDIASIAYDGSGQAYYTNSTLTGNGAFGVVDSLTFSGSTCTAHTTRVFSNLPAAHGMRLDPLTGDLFLDGAKMIAQVHPNGLSSSIAGEIVFDSATCTASVPCKVESGITLGNQFDQAAVDGRGHILAAVNDGNLVFIDYSVSKSIASPGLVTKTFLADSLDDVAPLVGPGAAPITTVPVPASTTGDGTIRDTAQVNGFQPTGTVTFSLHGPSAPTAPVCNAGNRVWASSPIALSAGGTAETPLIPAPAAAGTYQWVAVYSGDTKNLSSSSACGDEPVVVTKGTPTLTTTAVAGPLVVGSPIHDVAHLSGGSGAPTGAISFQVYGPGDTSCSTPLTPQPTGQTVNGAADYISGDFSASSPGTYRWRAFYGGDGANIAVSTPCNDANESSTIQSTSLTVVKRDAATTALIDGASFQLWSDANGNGQLDALDTKVGGTVGTTGGSYTWTPLAFGKYLVEETSAPTGYTKDSPVVQAVTITAGAGANASLTFQDPQILSSIKVVKLDAATGAPLAGAIFGLRSTATGADRATCTTAADGSCTFSGLSFGTYYVVEEHAPSGYDLSSPATQGPVSVNAANAGSTQTFTFNNPHKLSGLTVKKIDDVSKALLAGAHFDLRSPDQNGTTKGSCITDASGTCSVTGLDFGTYVWVETRAPAGYLLPTPAFSDPITITAANAGGTTTVDFADPHKLSNIKVQKHDATLNGALIDGATFQLWLDNGDGSFNAASDTKVGGAVNTTGGAYTWSNLDFGVYFVQEVSAPTGYQLPAQSVQKVTITAANAGGTTTVDFADPHKLTDITVVKQDAVDQSLLDGAVFALRHTAGGANILTCTTNSGSCTFPQLDFGTYYVVELTAPAGYSLPVQTTQGPYTITTANASQTVTVTFSDPRLPGTIKAEKVDANGGAGLPGAIFELRSGSANGSAVATQSSDASGNVTFTGVAFGTYYVVEVTPPLGYSLPAVTACGPISIAANHVSDYSTCTGEGAFTDAQKPASLSLDKQVQPSGGSTWSAVGLKGSSTAIDLSVDNGTSVVYRYVVVNTGQQTIEGLVVTDDRVSSGDITCLATTLAPAASTTCSSTPQTVTSQVKNTASVSGTFLTASGTHDVASNQDSVIVAPKVMSIAKTNDTTGPVAAGTAVHYTLSLTVTNGPVASATIVDELPVGIGAATAISDGGTYDASTNKITWNLANVATGKTLTYTATVSASAAPATYTNTATITSGPCVEAGCSATSKVDVGSLGLAKTVAVVNPALPPIAGIPQAQVGETLTYTITYTVTNGPLHSAVITDVLPATLTSAANPPFSISNGGTYSSTTNTITWNLGTLATGSGTVTYQVKATGAAAAAANQPFLNTATITTQEIGPISATAKVLVAALPEAAAGTPTPTPTPTPKITPPPTSTFDNGTSNGGGLNLAIVLLALAGLMTTIGLLVPAPSWARRRDRRS